MPESKEEWKRSFGQLSEFHWRRNSNWVSPRNVFRGKLKILLSLLIRSWIIFLFQIEEGCNRVILMPHQTPSSYPTQWSKAPQPDSQFPVSVPISFLILFFSVLELVFQEYNRRLLVLTDYVATSSGASPEPTRLDIVDEQIERLYSVRLMGID